LACPDNAQHRSGAALPGQLEELRLPLFVRSHFYALSVLRLWCVAAGSCYYA